MENREPGADHILLTEEMKPQILPKQPQTLGVVRQYMLALSASIPFAIAGSAIAWPSPTLPKIVAGEAPVPMDVSEMSWLVALLYLGNLVSPLPAGLLADRFGRHSCLLYTGALSVLSWVLIVLAADPAALYVARVLAGMQFGAASTVQPIYIGEIAQPDIRGTLSSLNTLFFGIGNLFTFIVGPYVSYYTLGIVSLILPAMFIFTFVYMPESPYYLVKKNEIEKARISLSWLRGDLNRIELEIELNQIENFVHNKLQRQGTFMEIFRNKASRKAMTISAVFSAVKRLSGNGVIQAYATLTLPALTFGVMNPDACVIVMGVATVLSSVFATLMADRFGRKVLLIISCLGCAVSMFAVTVWYFLRDKTHLDLSPVTFVPFVGYLMQIVFFNLACGPMGATVKGEMFPPHVKTKSSALATIVLASTSFVLNRAYLLLAKWEGVYVNYLIFSIGCLLGAFFTVFYVPETKGKTLQEIQDILAGKPKHRLVNPPEKRTY